MVGPWTSGLEIQNLEGPWIFPAGTFHTRYSQFFTNHPSLASDIRELVLENFIQASHNCPDEFLQGPYQKVQKKFDIPEEVVNIGNNGFPYVPQLMESNDIPSNLEGDGCSVEVDDTTAKVDFREKSRKSDNFNNYSSTLWSTDWSRWTSLRILQNMVYVKTYAITPDVLQLPRDMAKRFRYRVWSPFLKYLNDPEDKLEE
ncbi:unnamed protein product [Caenorhabditis nigoni]